MELMEQLYKIDTKGKNRVWYIEKDDTKYRTHSGLMDGKITASGWIFSEEKNIGKANHTSISEQVNIEVFAEYEKKKYQGKYHETLEKAGGGAKFFEAMLAHKYDPKKHTNFPYVSQPKLDGVRCLTSRFNMQTRNGKPFTSCPHILAELESFFLDNPDVVLDGELYNHDMADEFEKIISLVRKTKPKDEDIIATAKHVQYHVYDVITPKEMSFSDRYELINTLSGMNSVKVVHAEIVEDVESLNRLMEKYLFERYEGQMVRVDEVPYEHKRSKTLLKNKEFEDGEYLIVDIIEGVGSWAGMAKSVEILLPDGEVQSSGMRGNYEFAKKILDNREKLLKTEVTVRYQGKTTYGKLRFPIVTHFWEGKRDL